MTNEEIMKLLKEHEERKASDKPFTDEEYAEADAENKASPHHVRPPHHEEA